MATTKRKFKNGVIVCLGNQPDDIESHVPDHTRIKKRRVVIESSSEIYGTGQVDSPDWVLSQPGRTDEGVRAFAAEIFSMLVNRTDDIPDWLNDMRPVIINNETNPAQEEARQEQEKVDQKSLHAAREAARLHVQVRKII